jgi:hypothetical protein
VKSPKILNRIQPLSEHPQFYYNKSTYKYPKVNGVYIRDLHKMTELVFETGWERFSIPVAKLYEGVAIGNDNDSAQCSGTHLEVIAKADRLYTSCVIRDFKGGGKIGEMRLNRWEIYNGTYKDYHCTDSSFEVLDSQGYLAFGISYTESVLKPFVTIAGYFVHPDYILVFNPKIPRSSCFPKSSKNWERLAEAEIFNLKPSLESACD